MILSKDRGFDPLIKHLGLRGFTVRRANTLREACPPAAAVTRRPPPGRESVSVPVHEAALQWLSGSAKNRRPRTRKALAAYLYSHFAKRIPEVADYLPPVHAVKRKGKLVYSVSFLDHRGRQLPGGARRLSNAVDSRLDLNFEAVRKALSIERITEPLALEGAPPEPEEEEAA